MEKPNTTGPSPGEILSVIDLRDFAQHAITRMYPKDTVVVREGERTDSLYIIVAGRVKIYVSDDYGKEIALGESGPGEYFGEMVLDEGPRSASVTTLEPTHFLVVPKEDFREFLMKSPEFSLHLIRRLIKRVRTLTNDVKNLAVMDVYGRVARMLLDLAVERDGKLVIEGPPTPHEIAERIDTSPEMVNGILKDLTEGGYVMIERERITIARALPRAW